MNPQNYRTNGKAGAPKSCDICDGYRAGMNRLATCARYEVLVLLTSVCDGFESRVGHDAPLLTPEEETRLCGPWMRYPKSSQGRHRSE
ncbi:MAG: hypothetical protein ACLQEQ_08795 [Nitrososphaerales archaeon]